MSIKNSSHGLITKHRAHGYLSQVSKIRHVALDGLFEAGMAVVDEDANVELDVCDRAVRPCVKRKHHLTWSQMRAVRNQYPWDVCMSAALFVVGSFKAAFVWGV